MLLSILLLFIITLYGVIFSRVHLRMLENSAILIHYRYINEGIYVEFTTEGDREVT